MNLHRFIAYVVLACWIGLTAVVVSTAFQWSTARATTEIKIQRALNAQKEAAATAATDTQENAKNGADQTDQPALTQRQHERLLVKAEDASEEMAEAITFEMIERKQFWWEFAVWGGLTLLCSALLAERSDERSAAHR